MEHLHGCLIAQINMIKTQAHTVKPAFKGGHSLITQTLGGGG